MAGVLFIQFFIGRFRSAWAVKFDLGGRNILVWQLGEFQLVVLSVYPGWVLASATIPCPFRSQPVFLEGIRRQHNREPDAFLS